MVTAHKGTHTITINVGYVPCPKCNKGSLSPKLKEIHRWRGLHRVFDHFENYYQCSYCGHLLLGCKESTPILKDALLAKVLSLRRLI